MWEPQPGFQTDALEARNIVHELFGGGNRGGGKSDWLLMDYLVDVYEGGKHWNGILFRRTYSQFRQLIDRSKELFKAFYPGAVFTESGAKPLTWSFPNEATLTFFHMKEDKDAEKHLGLQYPWIGWDELPHWPRPHPYRRLIACNRSSVRLPRRIRATGNPGGSGLGWIKSHFKIPGGSGHPGGDIFQDPRTKKTRMFLRSSMRENKIFLKDNPDYIGTILAATEGNPQLEKAWLGGDFDVFFGKFFEKFDTEVHCVDPFELLGPSLKIPDDWKLEASLDYGEAKPTSFALWAIDHNGKSYRIAEYYKANLWIDQHAANIKNLIQHCPYTKGRKPSRVYADGSIFHTRVDGSATAVNRYVSDVIRAEAGINLVPANKDRVTGWRFMKNMLAWKDDGEGNVIKPPHIFYFPECKDFEREMDNAVHAGDEDSPHEDLDTEGDDHALDEARYFCMGHYPSRRRPENDGTLSVPTFGMYKERMKNGWKSEGVRESFAVPGSGVDIDNILQGEAVPMPEEGKLLTTYGELLN